MEIPQYLVKAEREVPSDVLEDAQPRSKHRNPIRYVRPQVPPVGGAVALAGQAERLARIAAGEDVDPGHGVPVDLGDVTEVGDAGVMVGHDAGGGLCRAGVLLAGRLVFGVPEEFAAEDGLRAHFEAAVSGEQ